MAEVSALFVTALAILVFTIIFVKVYNLHHKSGCPPLPVGNRGLPVLGETLELLRSMRENRLDEFVDSRRVKHGWEVFRTSLFLHTTAVLAGPGASRFLYSVDGKLVVKSWPPATVNLLGLIAQSGAVHKRQRRFIASCLKPEVLQRLVAKVDVLTQQHLDEKWQPKAGGERRLSNNNNDVLTLYDAVKSHAFNVASNLLLGAQDPPRLELLFSLFKTLISGLFTLPIYLPWTRYYKACSARASLVKLFNELLDDKRREIEAEASITPSGRPPPKDLVSTLLTSKDEHGTPLTQPELIGIIIALLFAGHDTNSSTITMACKFLAENRAICEEVLKDFSLHAGLQHEPKVFSQPYEV